MVVFLREPLTVGDAAFEKGGNHPSKLELKYPKNWPFL